MDILGKSEECPRRSQFLIGFWAVILAAVCIWIHFDTPGWDVQVYVAAIHSLHAGHDPYADAIAIQNAFHSVRGFDPNGDPPYSYVYSPMTLPFVNWIGKLPFWFSGSGYWVVYIAGILAQLWFVMQFVHVSERRYFLYLAPVSIFFPGLLENGTVISGNIAYILYPAVLLCAVLGWRRGNWTWFYVAALAASCVKAPLLSLVVIPVLSARKQLIPVALTTVVGVALFITQPLIWPSLFQNYLHAVNLQFQYNLDFGCSPAGLVSSALYAHGIPYSPNGLIFYVCYAVPLIALLWILSRKFLNGEFTLCNWIPVMLVGVILLNPRIMEYDAAPVTLLLALIAWRLFARFTTVSNTMICMALLIAVTNGIAAFGWYIRKLVDGPLLVVVFAAGCWTLLQYSETPAVEPEYELALP